MAPLRINALRVGRIAQVWNAIIADDHATARNLISNSPFINWPYELGLDYATLYPEARAEQAALPIETARK